MNTKDNIINDEILEELYHKLRPVVTVNGAKYLLKKYTLEQIKKEVYLTNKNTNKEVYLDNSELKVIGSFDYAKEYENPLSFTPTIGDVLIEIPKIYLDKADAFEITGIPRISGKNHIAKVLTYKINKK